MFILRVRAWPKRHILLGYNILNTPCVSTCGLLCDTSHFQVRCISTMVTNLSTLILINSICLARTLTVYLLLIIMNSLSLRSIGELQFYLRCSLPSCEGAYISYSSQRPITLNLLLTSTIVKGMFGVMLNEACLIGP